MIMHYLSNGYALTDNANSGTFLSNLSTVMAIVSDKIVFTYSYEYCLFVIQFLVKEYKLYIWSMYIKYVLFVYVFGT